jgi:capsular polysaccharide biosynthesis protein
MELIRVLRVLLRRWWLLVLPVLVVALVAVPDLIRNESGGAVTYTTQFSYSAVQQDSNLPNRDGDFQDVWLSSEFVVNAFTDWVQYSTFRDALADELAQQGAAEVDLGPLGIAADNSRSIGRVYMSYPSAPELEQIAGAAIDVLQTRNQLYFSQLGDQPADVTILNEPQIVAQAPPLTNRFAPILQLVIGLVAGVLLAFVAEYLDPTVRYSADLEHRGLRVLAKVPRRRRFLA